MKRYDKQPLTFTQQIELLRSRGMVIENTEEAENILADISYYRMSAYMLPFKVILDDGTATDKYKPGASWNKVYDLYKFDRKLRLLVFDMIERIEVALRTQVIYQLSHKYGSHWTDEKGRIRFVSCKDIKRWTHNRSGHIRKPATTYTGRD